MAFLFEKLDVYKLSLEFVEDVYRFLRNSRGRESYKIADQLQRAALSIPLNIAEGNGRQHGKEKRQFFCIARGSLLECVPLIQLCSRIGVLDQQNFLVLYSKAEKTSKMLSGLIGSVDKRINRNLEKGKLWKSG